MRVVPTPNLVFDIMISIHFDIEVCVSSFQYQKIVGYKRFKQNLKKNLFEKFQKSWKFLDLNIC